MRKKETFCTMIIIFIFMIVSDLLGAPSPKIFNHNREPKQFVIRRFALVIGANNGGPHRVKLRYVVSDAKSILNVLETMGGVSPDDSRLLVEPSRETFFWEIKRLVERVKRASENHYLISSLRGAEDTSRDGRITLSETYQFAFNETLIRTADTMSGPQHPNQHIQMSGTGDVVTTDIRRSLAPLSWFLSLKLGK